MPHTVDTVSQRVPAWKRLGLKLKNAKEDDNAVLNVHKRKRQLEERDTAHVKRPKSVDTSPIASPANARDAQGTKKGRKSKAPKSTLETTTQSPQQVQSPTLSRQKSVSFTPDTKVDDGDSTKQLINSWVTEQKVRDPDFDSKTAEAYSVPEAAKVAEDIDPTLPEPERRVQRVKTKEKAGKAVKKNPDKFPKLDAALSYLDAFCNAKDQWRFNKKHQTTLLKNVFDIKRIPSDHIERLYIYIKGLQGLARKTLRDSALAVKVKDMEESREAKDVAAQARYDAAIKEYVAATIANNAPPAMGYEEGILLGLSDFAMKERVAKRIRAERLINEIVQADADAASQATTTTTTATSSSGTVDGEGGDGIEESSNKRAKLENGKTARRRKQRTQEVVEDSSSSESSSGAESDTEDSDSEDDGSEDEDKADKEGEDVETSSSESSTSSEGDSSSGGSEDDDGSDAGPESQ